MRGRWSGNDRLDRLDDDRDLTDADSYLNEPNPSRVWNRLPNANPRLVMKIAIIGSGITGLAAAYRLAGQAGYHVTLIERGPTTGLAANNFNWQTDRKPSRWRGDPGDPTTNRAVANPTDELTSQLRGDLPLRMFNAANWPSLLDLYQQAGVEFLPVSATQSFSQHNRVYLAINDAMRPRLSTQMIHRSNRSIVSDAQRLKRQGKADLNNPLDPRETLSQYLDRQGYSDEFKYRFLYPTLSSTVCTCSYASLDRYPADVVLAALDRITHGRPLQRLKNSAADVASRLTASVDDLRFSCTVRSIEDRNHEAIVWFSDGSHETFDQVLVATQANTAARLIEQDDQRQSLLRSIQYEDVSVVVHQDESLMPSKPSNWSTFNMSLSDDARSAMCTVWMNRFANWPAADNLFQSINPIEDATIDSQAVVAKVRLQRPVVTWQSQAAIGQIASKQSLRPSRVLLAGSWAAAGVPLLESGVRSAWAACEVIERNNTMAKST